MTIDEMYGYNFPMNDDLLAINNGFNNQLANLALMMGKELKPLAIVTKDKTINRGEIQQKGVKASEKSILDVTKLTPLLGVEGAENTFGEVALVRAAQTGLGFTYDEVDKCEAVLFLDYILATNLCFVEVFNGDRVDKFFGTRSTKIISQLCDTNVVQINKWSHYLFANKDDYMWGNLNILKLNVSKETNKVIQSRTPFNLSKNIRVTPIYFMSIFVNAIIPILENNIVRFTYIKDNLTERTMDSSLSANIIMNYYRDEQICNKMIKGVDKRLDRGFIRLPELGISKYDASYVRVLNLTRITKVEIIDSIDDSYIDVDLDTCVDSFKNNIDKYVDNRQMLMIICDSIFETWDKTISNVAIISTLTTWVESQVVIGTTTFKKQLHSFMKSMPQVFTTYTGKPNVYMPKNNFDLGMEE